MYGRGVAGVDQLLPPAFVRLAAHPLRWRLLTELRHGDLRVRELVARVGEPQNLVSYHLRLLRDGGLVTSARSSFDGRDSYYHLDLDRCARAVTAAAAALHPALALGAAAPQFPADRPGAGRPAVLFVCMGNSARSPIAEALLHHRAAGRVAVASAGTRPKPGVHSDAVRVLSEGYGVDIAGQRPRPLDSVTHRRFDYVITLCDRAREACPDFGDDRRLLHWSVPDPAAAGTGYPAFRRAAADIDTRVRYLLPVLTQDTSQEVEQ
jgi:protein-tyrosine-phosphatase/DNA-binding transcriptional ArsR family regulator